MMPVLRQPRGVYAGRAADVEDAQRPVGQVASHDLTGPQQLQLAEPASDALSLVEFVAVVLDDLLRRSMFAHPVPVSSQRTRCRRERARLRPAAADARSPTAGGEASRGPASSPR